MSPHFEQVARLDVLNGFLTCDRNESFQLKLSQDDESKSKKMVKWSDSRIRVTFITTAGRIKLSKIFNLPLFLNVVFHIIAQSVFSKLFKFRVNRHIDFKGNSSRGASTNPNRIYEYDQEKGREHPD